MVREPVRVTVYRPDIGTLLPVYVHDRYEGFEVRTFAECSLAEIEDYVGRNALAVEQVADRAGVELALANHLIMGPAILARALAPRGVPYAVKVHGSALEYSVEPDLERFLPLRPRGPHPGRRPVLVGSRPERRACGRRSATTSSPGGRGSGPPGRRPAGWAAASPAAAAAGLQSSRAACGGDRVGRSAIDGDAFALDAPAAAALAGLDPRRDRIVSFTGKLIVSKGVDLLLAAWPLVLERVPAARLVIVGFGAFRSGLEQMAGSPRRRGPGPPARARRARPRARGRGARAPAHAPRLPRRPGPRGRPGATRSRPRGRPGRSPSPAGSSTPTLAELLPACEAQVVASTFPEAFGMVAAEAAACGVLPVSADHSGLAEVSRHLAAAVPSAAAPWLSFPLGPGAVAGLAGNLIGWLEAPPGLREATRAALAATAAADYSWTGVAGGVIAAAQGRLDGLAAP